ncbi:MAG TPA: alpha/beta hydrolase [Baekduia sp.]|nr:alpha/beta hydrolase [Baekduia sp.]
MAPLDPQCAQAVALLKARWHDGAMTVAAARAFEAETYTLVNRDDPPVGWRDVEVPAGDGARIGCRVYDPPPAAAPGGVLFWFHGGGFVLGSLEVCAFQAATLAVQSGCVVVAVDYRRAPEHPFPAAAEDCYAVVRWAAAHRDALGLPRDVPLAVAGDSAGGNLAAVVALLARDRGGPGLAFQLLAYPMIDRHVVTASRAEHADGWPSLAGAAWLWDLYLQRSTDAADPRASPLAAPTLRGLPPAFVMTAEHDLLRDEGELYAMHLRDSCVPVRLQRYDGLLHGFLGLARIVDRAHDGLRDAGAAVREAVATAAPVSASR